MQAPRRQSEQAVPKRGFNPGRRSSFEAHQSRSLEDVQQKVQYDLSYIGNMSLRMDFKILFWTVRTVFSGGGQ